jgi:serine/threonine protein kinase
MAPAAVPAAAAAAAATLVLRGVAGTPEWMAPEVIMCVSPGSAGYSFPADVWSSGCVLFALITGQVSCHHREHLP